MSSSDLSDLSSPLTTDDELANAPIRPGRLENYFKNATGKAKHSSPPAKKKRPPSPPHEYILADNPDIAFIVMFRSRFHDAFPKSLPHYGPQDIERGVIEGSPGEPVEKLLCALIGLVLNRKKDVEKGHYTRALEEAIHAHAGQWPTAWEGKNPLHGGGNFNNMGSTQRLTLLKTLIVWSLSSSEAIQAIIRDSYKQQRHEDDLNQPLSIQPWGRDGDKRRFWLVEGQDDTYFRLYRESNPALKNNTWRSVAGTIDELKEVATKLGEESTQAARRLQDRILAAIPRFEASEDKRKRRDYRNARKAQFTRQTDLGFSLYEGRTRGKRIKYTFSDEEEVASDGVSTRRSNRQSGISTPAEPAGPTFTASGRQVRSRLGGAYGESALSGQYENTNNLEAANVGQASDGHEQPITYGRGQRSAGRGTRNPGPSKNVRSYDGTDDDSAASTSGEEWDGGDEDEVDEHMVDGLEDEELEMSDDEVSMADDDEQVENRDHKLGSLVVSLRYQRKPSPRPIENNPCQKEVLSMNGDPRPQMAPTSVMQSQQAPEQFQTLEVQPGPSVQDTEPAMQGAEGDIMKSISPIPEMTQTPDQAA